MHPQGPLKIIYSFAHFFFSVGKGIDIPITITILNIICCEGANISSKNIQSVEVVLVSAKASIIAIRAGEASLPAANNLRTAAWDHNARRSSSSLGKNIYTWLLLLFYLLVLFIIYCLSGYWVRKNKNIVLFSRNS